MTDLIVVDLVRSLCIQCVNGEKTISHIYQFFGH